MSDSSESKKPVDSDFQQQRLKAWQPLLTPPWVISTFSCVGLLFIIIGVVILTTSNSVLEIETRYDNLPMPSNCVNLLNTTACRILVNITIPTRMSPPIYFYYKLSNFYQNHRRYVKSRSDLQLQGKNSPSDISQCDPLETNSNDMTLYPCGLIANSFFNDSFGASICDGTGLCKTLGTLDDQIAKNYTGNPYFRKDGISWSSDRSAKFKANPDALTVDHWTNIGVQGYQLPDVTDEDFIVWMRTAGLPTFKKLYRKMDYPLGFDAGSTVQVEVLNVFPVKSFEGQKSIVLSTTSWLGGKNLFLGWAYIAVGLLCLLVAAVFLIKQKFSPRPLGDLKYFKWSAAPNKRQSIATGR